MVAWDFVPQRKTDFFFFFQLFLINELKCLCVDLVLVFFSYSAWKYKVKNTADQTYRQIMYSFPYSAQHLGCNSF